MGNYLKAAMGKIYLILFILTIPLINLFYGFFNNPDRGARSLVTDIDRDIPFLKAFVIPYLLWYVFIFTVLIYFLIKDEKTLVNSVLTIDICLIVCYMIYYNFQTMVPRPGVFGNDIFSTLVSMVYASDKPFNCFPSIHCLTSYIMIKAISRSKVRNYFNFTIIASISVTIILSTMFIKQHVVLDAISAIILGESIYELIYRFNKEKALPWTKKQFSSLMMKRKLEI